MSDNQTHSERKPVGSKGFWIALIILLAIAIGVVLPGFVRARSCSAQEACIRNFRIIDSGVQHPAMAFRLTDANKGQGTQVGAPTNTILHDMGRK